MENFSRSRDNEIKIHQNIIHLSEFESMSKGKRNYSSDYELSCLLGVKGDKNHSIRSYRADNFQLHYEITSDEDEKEEKNHLSDEIFNFPSRISFY
jgi:CRISPR/Cas system CMR-associated protein Cmr1 (group 7 of RAMP superfamily)